MTAKNRRAIMVIICLIMLGVAMVGYFVSTDEGVPGKYEAKDYILANHYAQTGALNSVTAIYLNYRLWDTLFEAMVLMLSAMAVITFSWSGKDE